MDRKNTLRILELDGGGMRGVFSTQILHRIFALYGLTVEDFDIVCGTSIGGIATIGLACGKTPLEINNLMAENGKNIFDASWWTFGEKKATIADKLLFLKGDEDSNPAIYYTNEIDQAHKRNKPLFDLIHSIAGEKSISDIPTKIMIPVIEYYAGDDRYLPAPHIVSNISLNGVTKQTYKDITNNTEKEWTLTDLGMATSAAPMYLPRWYIGGKPYIDGGVAQNNMSSIAYHAGLSIKPNASTVFVLSVGTGSTGLWVQQEAPNSNDFNFSNTLDVIEKLGAGITFHQEISNLSLDILSKHSRKNIYKYRANDVFPIADIEKCDIDSTSEESIAYLREKGNAVFLRDTAEIENFFNHFLL